MSIEKIKVGNIYEVNTDQEWILFEVQKRSDGSFKDIGYIFEIIVKTFKVLEEDKKNPGWFVEALWVDNIKMIARFNEKTLQDEIKAGNLQLISDSKDEENHEGMEYNEYTGKWHWGF